MNTVTAHQLESEDRPAAALRLVDPPTPEPRDATQGRQIGSRPDEDATQGRTLYEDPRDDATRAHRSAL